HPPHHHVYPLSLHGALPISQVDPKTSSPGTRSVTCWPTACTTPARSLPRTGRLGRRSPMPGRMMYGAPATVAQSGVLTLVARTRDRKSTRLNSSHLGSSYAV